MSADYTVNAHVAIGAYYGYAASGRVTQAIYTTRAGAHFGYVELLLHF